MKEQDVAIDQSMETSSEPYPYVAKNTFEFLQTVLRDGTQNTIPMYVSEERWVRNKNITGIYFSCNITQEELADMYGLTKQRIDQIISKTLLHFWENSIGYDQMKFPIDSLSTENPVTKHRIHGFSGVDQIRFESLISSGVDDEEVVKRFGVRLDLVRQTMRRMGKREQITSNVEVNNRTLEQLETLPVGNYEERQKVMDQVTLHCYKYCRESFVSISDVAYTLGRKAPRSRYINADEFVDELKGMNVPVGMGVQPCSLKSGEGVGKRCIFIHKKDYLRLQENLGLLTGPSETRGPIL